MGCWLYFFSLMGWTLLLMAAAKKCKFGQAVFSAACGMLFAAYWLVVALQWMAAAAYGLMLGGLAAFLAGLVLTCLDRRDLRKRLFQPSVLVFALLCAAGVFLCRNTVVADHDSFSYWMRVVREMYLDERFPIHMDTNMAHTDYIPLLASLQYCVVRVFGWEDAGLLYVTGGLVLAGMAALAELCSEKPVFVAVAQLLLVYAFSLFGFGCFEARSDGSMAALFAAGTLCLFLRRDDEPVSFLPSLAAAAVLPGMKIYSGLLFGVAICLAMLFTPPGVETSSRRTTRALGAAALILAAALHLSWSMLSSYHSQLAYAQNELAKAAYGLTPAATETASVSLEGNYRTAELLESLSSGALWEKLLPLIRAFFQEFWASVYPWLLLCAVATAVVLSLLSKKPLRRRIPAAFSVLLLAGACYVLGLFGGFVVQTEIAAASMNYLRTVAVPLALGIVTALLRFFAERSREWKRASLLNGAVFAALAAVLALLLPPARFLALLPVPGDTCALEEFAQGLYQDELGGFPFTEQKNRHALLIDSSYGASEIKSTSGKEYGYQYYALPMRIHVMQYPVADYDRLDELTADNIFSILRSHRCDYLILRLEDDVYWDAVCSELDLWEWDERVAVYEVDYESDDVSFTLVEPQP